ncbi:MAG: ABC transporter ATP-binding protein [Cylindrospermopsis raciborskii KL1]|jgi:multiple sugar transport system ATP-binding protein|uniref:ABC transporter ATP-binding protein n=1 Tax=Cylindrospermopsis raciborskii TaxID=77022 RepID=UPI001A30FFE9|nr:ABC transporter ATP-binding protein [Cylindrospermopsis raciborskii]MBG0744712.1 ABC transporter ATP-binding protein [Cylindrospermopsis raciborskii KL1]
MAKLQLKDLNKSYTPTITPVKNINLTVGNNEFLTLLGPSGCGKSTILRMIAGLETPSRGQILLGGEDITLKSPRARNIAMVFQSYALYPHITVFENLASGLKLRKIPHAEIYRRVQQVSKSLELEELLQRKPGQLSGGQRQRVALGRALVRNAQVYLLDEPLSNLDGTLREKVRADIKQIFAQETSPVVYVTHDQTEAMTLSSKVAVINNGTVQQLDSPTFIYKQPANLFVAGFVGSPQMNLLTLPCNGNYAILGENKLLIPNSDKTLSKIVLGIRPEDIYIAKPEDRHTVSGKICLVENLGMHNLVTLRVDSVDNYQPIPLNIRILLPTHQTWNNQLITISLPPKNLHWFDFQSGNRLGFN